MKQLDAFVKQLKPITDKLKPLADKLKPFTEKVKPVADKTSRFFQKFGPHALTHFIWAIAAIVAFFIGLMWGSNVTSPKRLAYYQKLGITEVLDSFTAVMPEGAQVIARFNDERHSLYYLKSGHLMRFNAVSKMLDEVEPQKLNANIDIYYDDNDDQSGIITAKLSKDEKYILMTAVTQMRTKSDEPLKTANYQLNTESLNLLGYDGRALDPAPVKKDSLKVQKKTYKREEENDSEEETGAAEGTAESPAPATAPAAEPAPAAPAPSNGGEKPAAESSHGQETVVVPAQ